MIETMILAEAVVKEMIISFLC